MKIYSLLPRLSSQLGHIFHYHCSVQRAVNLVGWDYFAFFPKKAKIPSTLPQNWTPSLASDISETPKNLFQKIKFLTSNILPFRKIFQNIEKDNHAAIFLEHFEFPHLISIAIALCFLTPQFHFWILYRYELNGRSVKALLCRLFHKYLQRKLDPKKVKFLTDSDLLSQTLGKSLHCSFTVVPIPHTELKRTTKTASHPLLVWWPGGLIREDKGLSKVQKIAESIQGKREIQLILADAAKPMFCSFQQIHFIPTILPRKDYIEWMQRVDLILLPYSPKDYCYRTSGIFVEAISLGTIPVVTKDTWMAYELDKFSLRELIFDWGESTLVEQLCTLPFQEEAIKKLENMRSHYQNFHSEKGFATELQKIATNTLE